MSNANGENVPGFNENLVDIQNHLDCFQFRRYVLMLLFFK